jgi:hypothetical protein
MIELVRMVERIAQDLEGLKIIYALTGSLASSVHGRPQSSFDADIVLRMTEQDAAALAQQWSKRYYVSEEAMRRAAKASTIANIVDASTGWKVDLSVVPSSAFYDSVLARRERLLLPEGASEIYVCSAEDTILMKLLWRKKSRSTKQFDNVLDIVKRQRERLDWVYLRRWAETLDVADDLRELEDAGAD